MSDQISSQITVGMGRLEMSDGKLKTGIVMSVNNPDGTTITTSFSAEAAVWIAERMIKVAAEVLDQVDPLALIHGDLQNLQARCDVIQNLLVKRAPQPVPKVSRK